MDDRYPPIADYGLIGDCHTCALVSRDASIDWACLPRFDSGSCFGRLLDRERGGHCSVQPVGEAWETFQSYADETLVLVTTFRGDAGEARVTDCFTLAADGPAESHHEILRVIEGVRGTLDLRVVVEPRYDFGEVRPWIRHEGVGVHAAIGGDDGIVVSFDEELEPAGDGDALVGAFRLRAGERRRLSLRYERPQDIDAQEHRPLDPAAADERLEATREWWTSWTAGTRAPDQHRAELTRSAMVLRALTYEPTGAIVAAATTSLPESLEGGRTWDYRYSWIRDSVYAARSLADIGYEGAADRFRRFIQRTAAGRAEELRIMYGVGGERRLDERQIETLEGYAGLGPVRIGNAAASQLQLDVYGELLNLFWRWHRRGQSPNDDDWRFVLELVEAAAGSWREPDRGIWEVRGRRRHFVHSKALCWSALERGVALSEECMRRAPVDRWRRVRDEIREAVEEEGYDDDRGVFVQAFGMKAMDAALLRLPSFGFLAWDDPRMVRTTDAVREELTEDGLLRRYRTADGEPGTEGAFLACSFWLVECLARQDRDAEAREVYDRTLATANHLGLFAEEYDVDAERMLGNFPQGLTHLSHIAAALALVEGRA